MFLVIIVAVVRGLKLLHLTINYFISNLYKIDFFFKIINILYLKVMLKINSSLKFRKTLRLISDHIQEIMPIRVSIFDSNKDLPLGRWKNHGELNKIKIDANNDDHCGCCDMYKNTVTK
mgnify:FL=1